MQTLAFKQTHTHTDVHTCLHISIRYMVDGIVQDRIKKSINFYTNTE